MTQGYEEAEDALEKEMQACRDEHAREMHERRQEYARMFKESSDLYASHLKDLREEVGKVRESASDIQASVAVIRHVSNLHEDHLQKLYNRVNENEKQIAGVAVKVSVTSGLIGGVGAVIILQKRCGNCRTIFL